MNDGAGDGISGFNLYRLMTAGPTFGLIYLLANELGAGDATQNPTGGAVQQGAIELGLEEALEEALKGALNSAFRRALARAFDRA
ncbi:MAG: hypothetical protein NTX53_08105 [candidate division WOR-3 bacterium]|nr:hypothetical protein [candidate division WOR-3 bacterium]